MSDSEMSPASKTSDVHRLVMHLKSGKQIVGNGQYIGKLPTKDTYFLCCDNDGCCDSYMNESELLEYIAESDNWKAIGV